ncbi:Protein argonaute 4B [Carex littledalei]|uniref:Protein argonaute 4B n=1 Tax=Carex littledalei TaxID=544730 RepID=A0A833VK24_9POAL|nr:Protein argonaute 4B [Carex littledalei]
MDKECDIDDILNYRACAEKQLQILILSDRVVVGVGFDCNPMICTSDDTGPMLDGMNSLLQVEDIPSIPLISKVPTIILGMDVSHGSPGQSDRPYIADVVSSRQWPLISKYRASVHTQSPKLEMIDSLFKPKDKCMPSS